MGIACLDSLNVKQSVKQTHSKKTIADKWVVSGYIQTKGKAENVGRFNVGICEVGKNPQFNSVDAQIALTIVRDVLGALTLTDQQAAQVANIPIVQALHARQAMLQSADAIAEARARVKPAKGTEPVNPLVNQVAAGLAKLDEMIADEEQTAPAAEQTGNTGATVGAALTGRVRK